MMVFLRGGPASPCQLKVSRDVHATYLIRAVFAGAAGWSLAITFPLSLHLYVPIFSH
jgi:hypothetical protein